MRRRVHRRTKRERFGLPSRRRITKGKGKAMECIYRYETWGRSGVPIMKAMREKNREKVEKQLAATLSESPALAGRVLQSDDDGWTWVPVVSHRGGIGR